MSFSINDIRSNVELDGARPSQFQVTITNPISPGADIKVPFLCEAADIPASSLGEVPIYYFGRAVYFAGDREFDPWTVTIINDEDFLIRNAMENWQNAINSLEGNLRNTGTPSATAYKSQATVSQLGKTGNTIRVYQFSGLFPTQISPISLAWASTNEIERYQVTFRYDNWEVVGGTTGDAGGR